MSANRQPTGLNLPLIAAVGIAVLAIVASLFTVGLAVVSADRELPEQYHWEGFKLDRDFARFERAVALDVRGTLSVPSARGVCTLRLTLNGTPPPNLDLVLVHATMPRLDQRVRLARSGELYEHSCTGAPAGSWRVEIADAAGEWSVRQTVSGSLADVSISAAP